MTRLRRLLLAGLVLLSLLLAYLMRDVVYDVVIVPLAYLYWIAKYYLSGIPQLLLWTVLVAVLFLAVVWNLIPDIRPYRRREPMPRPPEGQVESLALWVVKARRGNYFKWQLANRLGRIARQLAEGSAGHSAPLPSGGQAVDKYLDAGLNHSFVDFPSPRSRFESRPPTPLDLDPSQVADYLESHMENTSGRSR